MSDEVADDRLLLLTQGLRTSPSAFSAEPAQAPGVGAAGRPQSSREPAVGLLLSPWREPQGSTRCGPGGNGRHLPCPAQVRGRPGAARGRSAPPVPAAFSPTRCLSLRGLEGGPQGSRYPIGSPHPCVLQSFLRISGSLIHLLLLPCAAVDFGVFKSFMWIREEKSSLWDQTPILIRTSLRTLFFLFSA